MSSIAAAPGGAGKGLPLPVVLAFASAGMPAAMLGLLLGTYMPRFYAGEIGISLMAVGAATAAVRTIDIFIDLSLGWAMDRTRTRFGRYRVWYAAGLPVLLFGIYKIFNPPADADTGYLMMWLLFLYIGLSIMILSHAAWAAALATGYNERSRVYGWMQAVGVVGAITLLLMPLLTNGAIKPGAGDSMGKLGWVIIALMPFTAAASIFFAPEKLSTEKRERASLGDYAAIFKSPSMARLVVADLFLVLGPGLTGPIYIFFFHDAKGFSIEQVSYLLIPYIGAGIFGAPIWARIAQKLNKHRTVQVACVAYAITQSILMAIPKGLFIPTAIGMFAVGFCASAFVLLIRSMVADIGDQLRLQTGKERTGLLYALVTITQKFGSSINISIIFPILALVGYNAKDGAVNTPEAIQGLEMCYLFAPVLLVLVGGAMFFGYRLSEAEHGEIRRQLDDRDAELARAEVAEPGSTLGTPGPTPTPAAE
ncbi:MAG TPA: MFS transporter [Phenylobacterium sp.]